MKVPGLILDSKIEIRRFLKRACLALKNKENSTKPTLVEKHLHELKKYNILAYKGYKLD